MKSKLKKGDICRVIRNEKSHFKIGAIITLKDGPFKTKGGDLFWRAEDGKEHWFILESELEPINK